MPLPPDALGHPREARLPDWGGDGGLAGRLGTLDGAVQAEPLMRGALATH